ncbi:histone-lysine N-methyltransferase SETMAR [Trichonephila clavipes]|nr:histone-lysine N-methyltransferase SETMAR [Trichonephila clavipes]
MLGHCLAITLQEPSRNKAIVLLQDSPAGGATSYQLLRHSIKRQVAKMVAKNDANLALSPAFRYVSIESTLLCILKTFSNVHVWGFCWPVKVSKFRRVFLERLCSGSGRVGCCTVLLKFPKSVGMQKGHEWHMPISSIQLETRLVRQGNVFLVKVFLVGADDLRRGVRSGGSSLLISAEKRPENFDRQLGAEVKAMTLVGSNKNASRSGRPVEADKALIDVNRRITTREIGLMLNLSNSTVYDHLKGLGLSSKLDVWVPHVLSERNLCRRIDVCDSLLKRHENYPFLKRIITGDEKGHGAKKMNRLKPFPKPIFTKKSQGGLRTEINQINAKIRKSFAQLKRSRWRELCKNLDSRTTNSKLWRIVKKNNKEQEQCEESNSVIDTI